MSTNSFPSKSTFITILSLVYVFFLAWFAWLYFQGYREGTANILSNLYGIIPLAGGLWGLFTAKHWGGLKSIVGKAKIFLSLGTLSWGLGIVIWLYYNLILQVEIPYPSWADAGFVIALPLWTIGAIYLAVATGAKSGLKRLGGKAVLAVLPIIVIIASYYFLVVVARGGMFELSGAGLQVFFDLAYPIGDIIILTVAAVAYTLSYKYFGGQYRKAAYLILMSFVVMYLADFTFSYTTALETYYNGSLADVLFATTMVILSAGLAMLDPSSMRAKAVVSNSSTNTPSYGS